MDPPPENQDHPAPATEAPEYDPELLRWHNQSIRTFRFANKDDEADERIFPILETYSKAKPRPIDRPISIDDAKDLTIDLLDVDTLVADTKYHKNTHKTIMLLRRFMHSHKVDYAQDTFKEGLNLTAEEKNNNKLLHQIWLIRILGGNRLHVQQALTIYRQRKRDLH